MACSVYTCRCRLHKIRINKLDTYRYPRILFDAAQQFDPLFDDPLPNSHTQRERTDKALTESCKAQQGANLLVPCATCAVQFETLDFRAEMWLQRGKICAGKVR